jgi:hypothetical protein
MFAPGLNGWSARGAPLVRDRIHTSRKMFYDNTYNFFMMSANNFNRHQKYAFIFYIVYLK